MEMCGRKNRPPYKVVFLRTFSPEQPMDAPYFPVGGGEDGAAGWGIHAREKNCG